MWIADPKGIHHILQKSGYFYAKPSSARELVVLLVGRNGIGSAEGGRSAFLGSGLPNNVIGDVHKRRRRVVAPAFGLAEAKALLPYFMDAVTKARELRPYRPPEADSGSCCHQMTDKWSTIIENGKSGQSAIIDVNMWLGKAALDACVLFLSLGKGGLRLIAYLSKGSALELWTTTSALWTMRITRSPNLTRT